MTVNYIPYFNIILLHQNQNINLISDKFIPSQHKMGNITSKRSVEISSTPKKGVVEIKVGIFKPVIFLSLRFKGFIIKLSNLRFLMAIRLS